MGWEARVDVWTENVHIQMSEYHIKQLEFVLQTRMVTAVLYKKYKNDLIAFYCPKQWNKRHK